MRTTALFLLSASFCLAQYKVEPSGAPPSELAPEVSAALNKQGSKVLGADGKEVCEIWVAAAAPAGKEHGEESATFTAVPQGALLGAIRFADGGSDRRGQTIKPGVYTLRYSLFPINGDHQGVAPQRDFLLMTPAEEDKDPKATPNFDTLVAWSRKASNTPHPAVLSIWKQEPGDFKAGLSLIGEHDWVLQVKLGEKDLAIIVVGRAEG